MPRFDRRTGLVRSAEFAVVGAALRYKRSKLAADQASVLEDSGEAVERSSDDLYEETAKYEHELFEALEIIERLMGD
jgi:hypothetical protein